jgi:SOS-response transcriptional repressor LexA
MHISMSRLLLAAKSQGIHGPSAIAERLGESPQTINNWVDRGVSKRGLVRAEQVFGCSAAWLENGTGNPPADDRVAHGPVHRMVPVVSWATAGSWVQAVDPIAPGIAEEWLPTTRPVGPLAFALRARGDSMEPVIADGAVVIVDPDAAPGHGRVVVVRLGGGEVTIKRLVVDAGRSYLRPDNPRYPVLQLADDAVVCGVVKQVILDLD